MVEFCGGLQWVDYTDILHDNFTGCGGNHVVSMVLVRVMAWCIFSAKPLPESFIRENAFQYVICQMVAMVLVKKESNKLIFKYITVIIIFVELWNPFPVCEATSRFPACYESLQYPIFAVGMPATLKHCYETVCYGTVWTSMRHQCSIWIKANGQMIIELHCN